MPANTFNTNQHYVSQMLQRGFETEPGSGQVWVFDKRTGNKFTTAIRTVAAEHGYYDLGDSTLDAAMNRADGSASGIINKIRDAQSLAGIPREDREMLAGFVVLQMVRTRGFQEGFRHIGQTVVDTIRERGMEPPIDWEEHLTPERTREEYLRLIPGQLRELLPHLLNKDLLLFKTDSSVPFCISDNPVARNNTINDGGGIRGTLGWAVPGIEIYLPIGKTLTLCYMCPSIGRIYELEQSRLYSMGGFFLEDAFYYLRARDTGKAIIMKPENVRFQNSIQILNAERFVIASRDDFADAAELVERNPKARLGPRITINR